MKRQFFQFLHLPADIAAKNSISVRAKKVKDKNMENQSRDKKSFTIM